MLDALAALAKALLYAGILSAAGAVFAEATLRVSSDQAQLLERVMRRGALVTITACLASSLILIFQLGGQFDQATLGAVLASGAGAATGLRLIGAALLLTSAGDSSARLVRLSYAVLATLSFAFTGHPAAIGPAEGLLAFAHVSIASWWVGSLWLLRYACVQTDFAALVQLVRRFGALAAIVIGALVIAGLILIIALVDFTSDPWLLPYGQILAVKIGLVIVAVGFAAYNKLRLTPRLTGGDATAAAELRKIIGAELAVIAAVLAATSILTTYTTPYT